MGFLAQDVEKVLPDAVSKDKNGYYSIKYNEIIPVLVEAIKEQQLEIEELKNAIATNDNKKSGGKEIKSSDNKTEIAEAQLFNNIPNPFSNNTEIKFYIPEQSSFARILILDLQGKQLKIINLTDKGYNSIFINSSELYPGMFYYSLVVDNNIIDTKRMVVSE